MLLRRLLCSALSFATGLQVVQLLRPEPYLPDEWLVPLIISGVVTVGYLIYDMWRETEQRHAVIREIIDRLQKTEIAKPEKTGRCIG